MLYTLGRKSEYDKYLDSDPNASKGIGGSVWQDKQTIDLYLQKNAQPEFEIYGVEADWDLDTKPGSTMSVGSYKPSEVPWRSLTRNAKLIRLGQV